MQRFSHVLRVEERERREGGGEVLFVVMKRLDGAVDDVVLHLCIGNQHHVKGYQVRGLAHPFDRRVRRHLDDIGARQQRLAALHRVGRGVYRQHAHAADARVRLLDRRRAEREEKDIGLAAHEVLGLAHHVRRRHAHHVFPAEAGVGEVRLDDASDRLLRVEVARDALAFEIRDRLDRRVGPHMHRDAIGNERAGIADRRLWPLALVVAGAARIEGAVE